MCLGIEDAFFLPMNNEALLQKIEALEKALKASDERNKNLEIENKLLREKIDLILRRAFSPKSEVFAHPEFKIDIAQNSKIIELPVDSQKKSKPEPTAQKPRRKRVPADLPREIEYIDPLEVTQNPEAFRQIGKRSRKNSITKRVAFMFANTSVENMFPKSILKSLLSLLLSLPFFKNA